MTCDHADVRESIHNLTEVVKTLQNRFAYHTSYSCACEDLKSKLDRMQTQINGLVISRDHQTKQNKQFMETLDAHISNYTRVEPMLTTCPKCDGKGYIQC